MDSARDTPDADDNRTEEFCFEVPITNLELETNRVVDILYVMKEVSADIEALDCEIQENDNVHAPVKSNVNKNKLKEAEKANHLGVINAIVIDDDDDMDSNELKKTESTIILDDVEESETPITTVVNNESSNKKPANTITNSKVKESEVLKEAETADKIDSANAIVFNENVAKNNIKKHQETESEIILKDTQNSDSPISDLNTKKTADQNDKATTVLSDIESKTSAVIDDNVTLKEVTVHDTKSDSGVTILDNYKIETDVIVLDVSKTDSKSTIICDDDEHNKLPTQLPQPIALVEDKDDCSIVEATSTKRQTITNSEIKESEVLKEADSADETDSANAIVFNEDVAKNNIKKHQENESENILKDTQNSDSPISDLNTKKTADQNDKATTVLNDIESKTSAVIDDNVMHKEVTVHEIEKNETTLLKDNKSDSDVILLDNYKIDTDVIVLDGNKTDSESTIICDDDDEQNKLPTHLQQPIVIVEDKDDCSIVEATSRKRQIITEYDKIYKENSLMSELIEKCLDMENTEGMNRVINRTLLAIYKDLDEEYKKSDAFRKILIRTISHLDINPRKKFSHLKNLCDELKNHRTKKRVQFITLAKGDKDKESTSIAPVNRKVDTIIDLDDENNYINEQNNTKTAKIIESVQIDDSSDDDVILLNENDNSNKENKRKRKMADTRKKRRPKVKQYLKTFGLPKKVPNTDQDRLVPHISNMIADALNSNMDIIDHSSSDPASLLEPRREENVLLEMNEQKIKNIETHIGFLQSKIALLEECDVTIDNHYSPYIRCEEMKAMVVKLYKDLCRIKGIESTKRHEVRLQVISGHPEGPVRCLEEFLNANIDSEGNPPFPDMQDVVQCVCEANIRYYLQWDRTQIMAEAIALFTQFGRSMQKRRQKREYKYLMSKVKEEVRDPADEDPVLQARLMENTRIAKQNEQELLERYANLEHGVDPILDPELRLRIDQSEESYDDSDDDRHHDLEPMLNNIANSSIRKHMLSSNVVGSSTGQQDKMVPINVGPSTGQPILPNNVVGTIMGEPILPINVGSPSRGQPILLTYVLGTSAGQPILPSNLVGSSTGQPILPTNVNGPSTEQPILLPNVVGTSAGQPILPNNILGTSKEQPVLLTNVGGVYFFGTGTSKAIVLNDIIGPHIEEFIKPHKVPTNVGTNTAKYTELTNVVGPITMKPYVGSSEKETKTPLSPTIICTDNTTTSNINSIGSVGSSISVSNGNIVIQPSFDHVPQPQNTQNLVNSESSLYVMEFQKYITDQRTQALLKRKEFEEPKLAQPIIKKAKVVPKLKNGHTELSGILDKDLTVVEKSECSDAQNLSNAANLAKEILSLVQGDLHTEKNSIATENNKNTNQPADEKLNTINKLSSPNNPLPVKNISNFTTCGKLNPTVNLTNIDLNTLSTDYNYKVTNIESILNSLVKSEDGLNNVAKEMTDINKFSSEIYVGTVSKNIESTELETLQTENVDKDDISKIVKPEPLDIPSMLEDLGEGYTATIFDIEDPFMVIEISDSSESEDDDL